MASAIEQPLSWRYARLFRNGIASPDYDQPDVVTIGWRLARRGWGRPVDLPSYLWKEFEWRIARM